MTQTPDNLSRNIGRYIHVEPRRNVARPTGRTIEECLRTRSYDKERGITRSDMFICRTSGVPVPEYQAIVSGLCRIIAEAKSRLNIVDYGCFSTGTGEYSSPDWYQDKAMTGKVSDFGRQVSAYNLNRLLQNEPYQKKHPHFDVIVIDRDLTTDGEDRSNRFIFGYGPFPNNIISVKRFMHGIRDPQLRQLSLYLIGAHEFGHNLGLVNRHFNIGTHGLEAGHCNGESGACLMEQVNVGKKTIDQQARLMAGRNNLLCPDCTKEVEYRRGLAQQKGLYW